VTTAPTLDRPEEKSAGRTFDLNPPDLPVYVDRHCPECGLLEPHHRKDCPYGLEE
jgi:hypothetical protein